MNHATENAAPTTALDDLVLWRADLMTKMHFSSETIRRWMATGKLPAPDVDISQRTRGWRLSTLRRAGINLM